MPTNKPNLDFFIEFTDYNAIDSASLQSLQNISRAERTTISWMVLGFLPNRTPAIKPVQVHPAAMGFFF